MTTTISSPTSSLSSPSPSPTLSPTSASLSTTLTTQIARLNTQLASLRQEKQNLSTALLASSTIQNLVKSRERTARPGNRGGGESDDVYRRLDDVVTKQQMRNDITFHRLMNNVTSFPYMDPAPDSRMGTSTPGKKMLGLRFELPYTSISNYHKEHSHANNSSSTKNDDPDTQRIYLVVLDRTTTPNGKAYFTFQPHMNQIPKHIDVEGFAARYLPLPNTDTDDEEEETTSRSSPATESFQDDSGIDVTQDLTNIVNNGGNGQSTPTQPQTGNPPSIQPPPPISITNTNQSLPLFIQTTRNALLSWHYRKAHITNILNSLTIPASSPPKYTHHITLLNPNPPATYLSIEWITGHTAVLGINAHGLVEIARVFGPRIGRDDEVVDENGDGDGGTFQCHGIERLLEGVRLGELVGRLEEVAGVIGGGGGGGGGAG